MSTRGASKGMVLAGPMRQRIRLEEPVLTPDGLGGFTRNWQTVATVWAEIVYGGGDERMAAGQWTAQTTHRIRLRWRDGVTAQMRVVFGTRIFAIRAIVERDGKRRGLELMVEEGAGS